MKIVKFKNGKFAIRKLDFEGLCWVFLGREEDYWWFKRESIQEYCLFNGLEEARERARKLKENEKSKHKVIAKYPIGLLLLLFLTGCGSQIDFSGHVPPEKWIDTVTGKPIKISNVPVGY